MDFRLFMNRGGRGICRLLVLLQCLLPSPQVLAALTDLSDQPMFVTNSVPPNMMLTLSVEWPTGVVAAYKNAYDESSRYLGYFDPERCYGYYKSSGTALYNRPDTPGTNGRDANAAAAEYFRQTGAGTGTGNHQCTGAFSGNYLNWAAMHALDEFRFAMTGGDRVIDTATTTVVEKTRHTGDGGYGQFPIKSSSLSTITPLGFSTTYARVTTNGGALDPWGDAATRGRVIQISDNGTDANAFTNNAAVAAVYDRRGRLVTPAAAEAHTYTYLVRLQVCKSDSNSVLEYSSTTSDYNLCQAYGSIYKPIGLIQKNANRMRFGAVAYQYDGTQSHAKGVLRAKVKSVGPDLAIPSGSAQANTNAEWDSGTGIYVSNPDSSEATASGVTQSGVINYLNKFGKVNGYMTNDTLSELYYAGLRALRNLTPPAKYIEGLTPGSSNYDGFPIITTTVNDSNEVTSRPYRPIQYSCQKNNFVGIADTNTHTDVDLPGNVLTGYSGHPTGGEFTINSPTDEASNINVKTLTDTVGTMENPPSGFLPLGSFSAGRSNSYGVVGLAYWANTKDILIDNPSKPWTQGKQTAQTYWVDVRESGSNGPVNSQMWLAAKYGGFDDINGNGVPASTATWHTNSDTMSNTQGSGVFQGLSGPRPDNYFTGDNPDKMIASLSQIFNAVLSKSLSSSGATISTIDFSGGSTAGAYTVKYNSKDWTGDVFGNTIQVNTSGTPSVTKIWSAQAQTDIQAASSTYWNSRFIATTNPTATTANKGVAFRLASLNTTQQGYLGASATDRQNLLQYLRGDKTNEGTLYRARAHLLGDIVDSEASAVVGPDATYYDSFNPGYSAFKTSYASRAARVYAGANDGMLHAFSGDVSATQTDGGQEKWAYIPSFVLGGPSGSPTTDGLAARSALTGFIHRYYVDQTPYIRDVDFSRTRGATASATGDWHTVLVGGLGKGGKGFYALDVTNPAAITSEATLATKVLWEFSDEDMGYSFGRPIIAKTVRDGWVVILSSGYNNVSGSVAANRGMGYLYILNAKTGALIQKISTGAGSASSPSGFAHPLAFIPDSADYTLDYVYGGDLNGNLWRFDLTGTGATYPAPLLFAQLTDGSGTAQPVTVEPKVEIGDNGKDRWVFIGTGKMLASADLAVSSQQSFYAFRDGSRTKAYGSGTSLPANQLSLPSNGSFPISRSQMVRNTNLLIGYAKDQTHPMGWYYELVDPHEKISTPVVANEGVVSWTAYLPSTDPCSPGAASKTYAAEYDTGKSRITLNNATVEYFSSNSYLVKVQFVKDASGKIRAVLTTGDPSTSGGQIQALSGSFGRSYGKGVRVNWREILN